jgi:hypothetical protein
MKSRLIGSDEWIIGVNQGLHAASNLGFPSEVVSAKGYLGLRRSLTGN